LAEIGKIQSTNFQALLEDLGIVRNQIPFSLRSEVSPVVLVGGTVSFLAAPTPAYQVTDVFSAGVVTAPAINTILADTLALPVGGFTVQMIIFAGEQNIFEFEWRNAGNSANLVAQRFNLSNAGTIDQNIQFSTRLDVLNAGERFRVRLVGTGNVGVDYQASLFVKV